MKIAINIHQTATGCFRANCAVMPGCVAVGRTEDEVCQNMRRQIACYVASMDAVCPHQLDLMIVAVSTRPGGRLEPKLPTQTLGQLDACRKLPTPVQSGHPSPQ